MGFFVYGAEFLTFNDLNLNQADLKTEDFIFVSDIKKEILEEILKKKGKEKETWTYVVKKGETLWSISKKFKVSLNDLLEVNNFNEKIRAGDKILIPGVRPKVQAKVSVPKLAGKFVAALSKVGDLVVPVSGFNWGKPHGNNASDIAASCGTPVYSAEEGLVIESLDGWNSGYGNYIIIKHKGFYTLYGHLSLRVVEKGDYVSKGELIGYIGNTGYTVGLTGCHLHFEVRGKPNPFLK